MNVRNLEHFHETLICQYREMIQEAVYECETDHKTTMNLGKLNSKLRVICKAAEYDGISEDAINRLIEEVVPSTVTKAA